MKTSVRSHLTVFPGQAASVDIEVTNTTPIIDGVTAVVDGVDPSWVSLDSPVVPLFPDESGIVRLNFTVPWDADAGDYLIVVRVVSVVDPSREAIHDFWLAVEPRVGASLALVPQSVTGGRRASVVATVTNTGNVKTSVFVRALDPTRQVDAVVDPPVLDLERGASESVVIELRGPRNWWAETEHRTVTVTAEFDDDEDALEEVISFAQKPLIARGFITIATLVGIVALWAFIFTFLLNEIGRNDIPVKDLQSIEVAAADPSGELTTKRLFLTGEPDILLSSVAGRVEGLVTARTNGEPVGRVVVEALRLKEDELIPVASGATRDDGTFVFEALLPGTYKFKFTGDGYNQVWFPDGLGPATAEPIKLTPGANLERDDQLEVQLLGTLGGLSAEVALPPGSPDVQLTAKITQVDGEPDAPALEFDVIDGALIVEDALPTPGEFLVTINGDGFDAQEFTVDLDGGDAPILNTVSLEAGLGEIAGVVRDTQGEFLGLVDVVVTSGEFEAKTTTATVDDVGGFRVSDLSTPLTYVLTFSREGFSSETITLDLGPGESRTDVTKVEVALVGGSGRVTGTVVDANAAPLGGVTVEVVGDGFRSDTATLTTAGAGGGAGSFVMSGLPVPGDYAIMLSSDLQQTETLAVRFDDAETTDLGQIEMLSNVSEVRGTITGPNGNAGGLIVTLTDGLEVRTTTAATNPAGVFTFTGVPPGTYTVQADGAGFVTGVVLVTVDGGGTIEADIALEATSP